MTAGVIPYRKKGTLSNLSLNVMNNFDELLKCKGVAAAFNQKMSRKREGSFLKYLTELLDDYEDTFFGLGWDFGSPEKNTKYKQFEPGIREFIKTLKNGIILATKEYLNGHPARAYETFAQMMEFSVEGGSFNNIGIKNLYDLTHMEWGASPDFPVLYRMRVSPKRREVLERKNIFHVPFQDRHLVSSGRYSIPGFPCLYLSSSLLTCWEELGCPCFDNVFFSRFKIVDRPFKALYVAHLSPSEIVNVITNLLQQNKFDAALSEFAKHFSRWVLDLACAISKKDEDAPFHPEYIIPQLLFQWMTQNSDYDALCYRTVQIAAADDVNCWHILLNFVFPPKDISDISDQNISPALKKKFVLSEPISWELAASLQEDSNIKQDNTERQIFHNEFYRMHYTYFSPLKGKLQSYVASSFGKAETMSGTFQFDHVED